MSSLAQLMAGRKRDSPVWEYFEYDVASDKSVCKVTESGKPSCNIKMAGKNSSNLIAHLRRVHPDAYKRYCENEQSKKNEKIGVKRRKVEDDLKVQTIKDCFNSRTVTWSTDSAPASQAYVERIFSLCGLLSAGRRNRMLKSMEMRAFLKLNKHVF